MPASDSNHLIVVTLASNYIEVLEVCLSSLKRNYPAHPAVCVCHRGLSALQRRSLAARFDRILFIDIDEHPFPVGPGVLHQSDGSQAALFYARLLIWTELFDEYDVVLYMDIDTLVLGPLDEVFTTAGFFVVREAYEGPNRVLYDNHRADWLPMLEEDALDPALNEEAANGGVFAVSRSMRTRRQLDLIRTLIDRYSDYLAWSDQSLLNLWARMNGFVPEEKFEYNFQVRLFRDRLFHREYRTARILHFNGLAHTGALLGTMRTANRLASFPLGRRLLLPAYVRFVLEHAVWKRSITYRIRRLAKRLRLKSGQE